MSDLAEEEEDVVEEEVEPEIEEPEKEYFDKYNVDPFLVRREATLL
jgi:hypothetical protein